MRHKWAPQKVAVLLTGGAAQAQGSGFAPLAPLAVLLGGSGNTMPGKLLPVIAPATLSASTISAQNSALIGAGGTASSGALTAADQDFIYRSGRDSTRPQPGVLNWHKYDYVANVNDATLMATVSPSPILGFDARGPQITGTTVSYHYHWGAGELVQCDPAIDQTVKVSGSGSLRLTTAWWGSPYTHRNTLAAGGDPSNPGGYVGLNFSTDFSQFIGAGQKVYYQFRWRVDQAFMNAAYFGGDVLGVTHWSSKYAMTVSGSTLTASGYVGINPPYAPNYILRLYDASGNITGHHSIASISYPNGAGLGPSVITLSHTYDPTVGNFTAAVNVDPASVSLAYNNDRIGPKSVIGTVGDYFLGVIFGQNHVNNQMHWSDWASYKIPIMSQGHVPEVLEEGPTNGVFLEQNQLPLCTTSGASFSNCWRPQANEWMTIKVLIDLTNSTFYLAADGYYRWSNSEVKVWAAHEGQASQLLIWWHPGVTGYKELEAGGGMGAYANNAEQKYGKLNALNYLSYLDPLIQFPDSHQWYDQFIISTQDIPDPAIIVTNPTFAGMTSGQAVDIGSFNPPAAIGDATYTPQKLTDFSGFVYDDRRRQMVMIGGGHSGTNNDALMKLDLSVLPLPTWGAEYQPTPLADWYFRNYDDVRGAWNDPHLTNAASQASGPYPRAAARHTIDMQAVVGDELVVLEFVEGNQINLQGDWSASWGYQTNGGAIDHWANAPGRVAHYNFVNKAWSFSSTAVSNTFTSFGAAAYDPVSGKVLVVSRDGIWSYDPVAKTIAVVKVLSDAAMGANQNLIYFPPNDKFYYIWQGGAVWEIVYDRATPANTTITRLSITVSAPDAYPFAGNTECGVAYDSVNHLIGTGPFNNRFFAFDPVTRNWVGKAIAGAAPGNIAFHCIDFDPVNGVYIFINSAANGYHTFAFKW